MRASNNGQYNVEEEGSDCILATQITNIIDTIISTLLHCFLGFKVESENSCTLFAHTPLHECILRSSD